MPMKLIFLSLQSQAESIHYANYVYLYLLIILLSFIVDGLLAPKIKVIKLEKILASFDRVAADSEDSRVRSLYCVEAAEAEHKSIGEYLDEIIMKWAFLGVQADLHGLAYEILDIVNTSSQLVFVASLFVKYFAYFNLIREVSAGLTLE